MKTNLGENLLILTDSYKVTHWKQYPPGCTNVYSYFESRGGEFPETLFFGLQYLVKRYLQGQVITKEKIDEAEELFALHFGDKTLFNRKMWDHIVDRHKGILPIVIKAVPEGSIVPTHNVLMTIENTDPECPSLTNYLETLLVQTWYPITVATLSRNIRWLIQRFLRGNGTPELIDFKLHDFGFRGVSSVESAGIGGCAHLCNFKGTDTMAALIIARDYYDCQIAGFSIPASEHSTMTAWGREGETDAMLNMLEKYPKGTIACVSDQYDIYNACKEIWGTKLHDKVLAREGTLVVRPDSGDPPKVVVDVLDILGEKFGYTVNAKGYKVLDSHVRVIQGDGVDIAMIWKILAEMQLSTWSADNIAFGSGGALLQKLHRDTQKFAFKCSSVTINGINRDVYKQPITDPGKNSKAGRLALIKEGMKYKTVPEHYTINTGGHPSTKNELVEVFRDGKLLVNYTLDEIRERANIGV
jgi:nicotinamide phosphoribosyltransferase